MPLTSAAKLTSERLRWSGLFVEIGSITPRVLDDLAVEKATIFLCTGGCGRNQWRHNGKSYQIEVTPGSSCLMLPSYKKTDSRVVGSWEYCAVRLDVEALAIRHDPHWARFFRDTAVDFSFSDDKQIASIIQAICYEVESGAPSGLLYSEAISTALLSYICNKFTPRRRGRAPWQFSARQRSDIIDWIDSHLGDRIRIGELARHLNMTTPALARAFVRTFGQSPYSFVTAKRVLAAESALVDSHEPIVQIALRLGFSSHSHFSSIFHKATGLTPSEYRSAR